MGGFSFIRNIGAAVKTVHASDNAALTAGGTGDNTLVTGQIIDRSTYGTPLSVVVAIGVKAVLAANKKLTLKSVTIEHGDDSGLSDAANFATPADVDILVDSGSGSTLRGVSEYDLDLTGAKRYIRLKFTPDLNATGTDTGECASTFIFGGIPELPA